MKVILTQDVDTLGQKGDVVEVKPGYGRNFLIPRSLAVVASTSNVKRYEEEVRQQARQLEQKRKDAEAMTARLSQTEIVLQKPVGEEERLFGTVTTQEIVDELKKLGYDVDRRKVSLNQDIRTLGTYTAAVRLHPEHTAEVKVTVVPESLSESV
jgi:large subunit ribosomal protein L9